MQLLVEKFSQDVHKTEEITGENKISERTDQLENTLN
jgi:hypothetical protein